MKNCFIVATRRIGKQNNMLSFYCTHTVVKAYRSIYLYWLATLSCQSRWCVVTCFSLVL